jgi:arylsulfatase
MTTGEPGAYRDFGGHVRSTFSDSEPWWEPIRTPPDGSPNVILILCDDLGFSDLGCYGSEIETPNLDALAAVGVRLADFHTTPLCAPSRAALLTGMNHHAAGVGSVNAMDAGFPGYRGEIANNVSTMAEVFRHNGYRTLMVGKWHLQRSEEYSEADRRDSWPLQRGFDRFYGFMFFGTSLHHPSMLYEDNHVITVDKYPDGYYFTDDMTDRAIDMIRGVKGAEPRTPFFLYVAHGAMHAPLMAKAEDMAKYRGHYDAGWDAIREARFARQKQQGIVPAHAELPPRNFEPHYDSPAWEELSSKERAVFARHMEVYAGMLDNVDSNWGRLRDAVGQLGELDNTIVVFTSDNGASRDGGKNGTTQYFKFGGHSHVHLPIPDTVDIDYERLDLIGGPRLATHYPWGWAMACNTPFRLHKATTFQGGHHVPFIFAWPVRIHAAGEIRSQYAHLIDVLPSLIELIGLETPTQRDGNPVKPMSGTSFATFLSDGAAASQHVEQYYEMGGHRGYHKGDWESVTLHYPGTSFDDEHWQLYQLDRDPTQTTNLAVKHPDQVEELVQRWDEAAWANQVYPLDDGSSMALLSRRAGARQPEPITLYPGMPTLEAHRASLLIRNRSFVVRVRLDHRSDETGILFAHGDQGGGYCLFVDDDGRCTYSHNCYGSLTEVRCQVLSAGHHELVLSVGAPKPGAWYVQVLIDGVPAGEAKHLEALTAMAPWEGIDVGLDRRSPVNWELYVRHGPFPYSGTLHSVRYEPGPPAPVPAPSGQETYAQMLRYQ